MKKYVCNCLFILSCVAMLLFTSCGNEIDESDMNNIFFGEYVIDDTKTLESNLTKEYDLNELRSFFKESNANESIVMRPTESALMFTEVNDRYPVEILRTGSYSVYKVSQGGYFYVFWIKPFDTDTGQLSGEPSVYFSAYLSSDISSSAFDSLIPGISTAEDVRRIDPSFELSFLRSTGIFSYSYLDNDTILEIKYEYPENLDDYDDLIVKEKKIIARDSAPSRYSAVLASDLP